MAQHLTAGEGHTAAGGFVVGLILDKLLHDLLHRHFPAAHHQRLGVAHLGAGAATGALAPVNGMRTVFHLVGAHGANRQTFATTDAFILIVHEILLKGKGLRVVTPGAPQVTALEKNRGANARAITERKPLNIGNQMLHNSTLTHAPS